MKLSEEKWQEGHIVCNADTEKWVDDYVERETAAARMWVHDTEAVIRQELTDIKTAKNTGTTARKPQTTFGEEMNAIGV